MLTQTAGLFGKRVNASASTGERSSIALHAGNLFWFMIEFVNASAYE